MSIYFYPCAPLPAGHTYFSPTSVQFKSEINGAFLCKRHQKQHLEFLTAFLRTRRPGVRIPPGAPFSLINRRFSHPCIPLTQFRFSRILLSGKSHRPTVRSSKRQVEVSGGHFDLRNKFLTVRLNRSDLLHGETVKQLVSEMAARSQVPADYWKNIGMPAGKANWS